MSLVLWLMTTYHHNELSEHHSNGCEIWIDEVMGNGFVGGQLRLAFTGVCRVNVYTGSIFKSGRAIICDILNRSRATSMSSSLCH